MKKSSIQNGDHMAKHIPPIPKELSHLKIDERGYPIPFFVTNRNGKPDFVLLNTERQMQCVEKKLCPICGLKLYKDYSYVITGPLGLKNCMVTDPPMHRVCAEFSLRACPHMYFQKAERKETGVDRDAVQEAIHNLDKPAVLFLVKIDKIKQRPHEGHVYLNFRPVSAEQYEYRNGLLTKVELLDSRIKSI